MEKATKLFFFLDFKLIFYYSIFELLKIIYSNLKLLLFLLFPNIHRKKEKKTCHQHTKLLIPQYNINHRYNECI